MFSDYYEGEQRLLYSSEKWRRAFGGLFTAFADNWCELVVDAVDERLDVTGFRFGDEGGDADAWAIWQRNNLDADSQIAHTDSLIYGVSYALVWADADGEARIDVESPEQTIVSYLPGSRRHRAAGLKRWLGAGDVVNATLYMPDYLWKFEARAQTPSGRGASRRWSAGGRPARSPANPGRSPTRSAWCRSSRWSTGPGCALDSRM